MNSIRHYINIVENASGEYYGIEMDAGDSNTIMQRIWKSRYPDYALYVNGIEDSMPAWSTDQDFDETAEDSFYLSTRGNEINNDEGCVVSIDSAWSNQFKSVVKPYIQSCFEYMEQQWSQQYPEEELPQRIIRLYSRDGSGGIWGQIANSLGAELEDDPYH